MRARPNGPAILVPPHPLRGSASVYLVFGLLGSGCGGCMTRVAPNGLSFALLALGLIMLALGWRLRAGLRGLPAVNMALQLLRQGRGDDAVHVVGAVPAWSRRARVVRGGIGLVRATAALDEGAFADAERHASTSLEGRPQLSFFRAAERQIGASAQSARALARAGLGRLDEAIADARAVFATDEADPHALARASLAEALVLARRDDVEALAAHLRERGALVAEHGLPRERAVARGLARLVKARRAGVYREPAARDADARREPGAFARWAGTFAPGLADVMADVPDAQPVAFAAPVVAPAPVGARSATRVLFLWALLVMMFLAIWQFLTPAESRRTEALEDRPRRSAPAPEPEPTVTVKDHVVLGAEGLGVVGVLVLLLVVVGRRSEGAARDLAAARRKLALGDLEGGERALDALTQRGWLDVRLNGQYHAIACAELARLAVRRGDFAGAVGRCDRGLAILARAAGGQVGASDYALPWVLGERAVALAAARQPEAAAAEVGRVLSQCPGFVDAPTVTIRARFVADVARGVLDGAAETARSRTLDMPIPLHEDLLADVVLAARGVVPKDERERIADDLAAYPEIFAWVERMAPGLAASVRGTALPPASARTESGHGPS